MRPTGWLILLAAAAVLFFLTHPTFRRSRIRPWRGQRFAHRGLHDSGEKIVENTLPAFEAACEKGCGIELDIRFTRDFHVIVFHDDDLARLAGDGRKVSDLTLDELNKIPLCGIDSAHIPTLREVLDTISGRVPLLIEVKNGANNVRLCEALMAHLKGYRGAYIVESFNPLIVGWFRKNAPQIVRGQLVSPMKSYAAEASRVSALFMSGLLLNCIGRPDFVAYDANAKRFFSPHFQRALYRTPMAGWTVRSDELARVIKARGEMMIFEKIRP